MGGGNPVQRLATAVINPVAAATTAGTAQAAGYVKSEIEKAMAPNVPAAADQSAMGAMLPGEMTAQPEVAEGTKTLSRSGTIKNAGRRKGLAAGLLNLSSPSLMGS